MKQLLGLVVGVIVGTCTILALTWVGQNASLPPDCIPGIGTTEGVTKIGGWAFGALAGGIAAVRLGDWPASGWIIALLTIGFALAQTLIHPHPLWMQLSAIAVPFLAGVVVSGISRPA